MNRTHMHGIYHQYKLMLTKKNKQKWKKRSCADYAHQKSLQFILIHFPTTAGRAQFCLLCYQPEPIPGTLAARRPLFTQRVPCRLPLWSRMNHLHDLQDIMSSPTLHR